MIKSNFKIKLFEQFSEGILPVQTGVGQITFFHVPLGQSAVVKLLLGILNEERNDPEPQAFFQCNQPPHPAVAVLKRVDMLKIRMERDNIIDRDLFF